MFGQKTAILKRCFRRENFRLVLVLNTFIAVFLTLFGSPFLGAKNYLNMSYGLIFFVNWIYSQSIGLLIYLTVNLILSDIERLSYKQMLALIPAILLGTVSGTLVAALITHVTRLVTFDFDIYVAFLPYNIVAGLFFGSAIVMYFLLKARFEKVVAELAEKKVNEQKILQKKTQAELEALRARINPHFLFNALNSVASLIPTEPEKAENMIQKLSNLLRFTLDAGHREWITLGEELDIARQYLEVEKVRLGRRLQFEITLDKDLETLQTPGLIIQPLLENSIKHGIAKKTAGGSITVHCVREGDRASISIIDTGEGFPENAQAGNGLGLSSVQERLHLHYGEAHRFDIHSNEQGTRIHIMLPIEQPAGR